MQPESIWSKINWQKGAWLAFGLLILANLVFLDYLFFVPPKSKNNDLQATNRLQKIIPPENETPSPELVASDVCPLSCLEIVSEATASCLTQAPVAQKSPPLSGVKEFYVPLGASSTTSKTWEELAGIESVIDMANYPNVKSIIFEASMRIPTANGVVHAKLYNVTDKHDVWYSEVTAEGPTSYRAESAEINLTSGRKLYRVMMKSTMGYEAILDSARIKILLE